MVQSVNTQYSFPNVSVNETIIGPSQLLSSWRNTIGIAAPFSKGPLKAAITSRQEFVSIFGEDDSLGSIAVRQAMLQGATNFIISRTLPTAKGATASIALEHNVSPTLLEPTVAVGDARTVGLKLDLSLITDISRRDRWNAVRVLSGITNKWRDTEIVVNTTATPSLDFEGLGYLDFQLTEELTADNTYTALGTPIGIANTDLAATTGVEVVKVTFSKSEVNADEMFTAIKPGLVIEADTGATTVLASDGEILSYAFEEDNDNYAFYVKLEVTSTTTGAIELHAPADTERRYIVGYRFRPFGSEVLPGNPITFDDDYSLNDTLYGRNIGYLVLKRLADVGITKELLFLDDTGTGIDEVNFGINFTVGTSSDTELVINNQRFFLAFMKAEILIGETDTLATGFPNTSSAFPSGYTASQILGDIQAAVYNDSTLSALNPTVVISLSELPYSLNITLGAEGTVGNKVKYTLTNVTGGITTDITYKDNAVDQFGVENNLIDGVDELVPARRMFYDRLSNEVLYIEALSLGLDGNDIKVSITPVSEGVFNLSVSQDAALGATSLPAENYTLSNATVDLETGVYPETLDSNFIRAFFAPALNTSNPVLSAFELAQLPLRISPADNELGAGDSVDLPQHPNHVGSSRLQNIYLVGASVPAEYAEFIPEEAYSAAIDRLAEDDVAFLIAPGLVAGDIRYTSAIDALINQANTSTPTIGQRFAILATPPNLTPSRSEILNTQYSSPSVVLVGGWSSLATARGLARNALSPEGYYAGLLATTDTYISPASSSNGNYVTGVRSVDTSSKLSDLDAYTRNNIEMLYVDPSTGRVKFLNGRTTAGDLDNRWVAIKRQADHIASLISINLEWAKSAPNSNQTRTQVATAIDAILRTELRRGAITDFSNTVVDTSNAGRIAQGYMDVVYTWAPVFPADYIAVSSVRSISNQFSVQLGSST